MLYEYQMLLRRKADAAKICAAFKAQQVYGYAFGMRPYTGTDTNMEGAVLKNEVTFLSELNTDELFRFMQKNLTPNLYGDDCFVVGEGNPVECKILVSRIL